MPKKIKKAKKKFFDMVQDLIDEKYVSKSNVSFVKVEICDGIEYYVFTYHGKRRNYTYAVTLEEEE